MRLTFKSNERLKSKVLFEKLFNEGASITVFPIKLHYLKTDAFSEVPIKVAVSAPKRRFRKAVDRNRIKRLLREAYRLNKPLIFNNIEGNYAFLILYLGRKMPSYDILDGAFKEVLEKFKAQADETIA
ncbi:ribonuclease P protein component [Flagellimonas sp. DF-77]|uniref:ribonuclease P protein component n=1 Tax=Flagellimonas algarum TaxID=3230298 RepID=UPI003391F8CA